MFAICELTYTCYDKKYEG